MAKFNILSINKMTSGDRRGLIDMTISLDYDIASASMTKMRVIYEFEKSINDNSKTILQYDDSLKNILLPLNDLLDVCVKSQAKKSALNYNIPGDLIPKT